MYNNPIVLDKNVVGLLLLILAEGKVISSDMTKINRNYSSIKPVALKLCDAGLIVTETSPDHKTKVIWKLTEKGESIAVLLYEAEKQLERTSISEKYYKQ